MPAAAAAEAVLQYPLSCVGAWWPLTASEPTKHIVIGSWRIANARQPLLFAVLSAHGRAKAGCAGTRWLRRGSQRLAMRGAPPGAAGAQAGWGFDGGVLVRIFQSSHFLASLTLGLGAGVGDGELRALAAACPFLRRLELRFAAVTGAGAASA